MWLSNQGCSEIVEAVWDARGIDDPTFRTVYKIEKCGKELLKWSRDHFGNVKMLLKQKRKDWVHAEKEGMRIGQNFQLQELKKGDSKSGG